MIIFINYIINQLFIYDCTGLYVPFTTIFANTRKGGLSDSIKLPRPSFPLPCRCLRAVGQTKYLPETLFFLKHHDLHEKCRLKNISDGISSLRQ
ncbi:hypothetical protein DE8669_0401 [Neisseria meningitidis]|nr:hypothetical protein DE8669_0401 [Neisseria meningitidis]